jgi:hypothetical protein
MGKEHPTQGISPDSLHDDELDVNSVRVLWKGSACVHGTKEKRGRPDSCGLNYFCRSVTNGTEMYLFKQRKKKGQWKSGLSRLRA